MEVGIIQKQIVYSDSSAVLIGQLPANAKIIDVKALVSTAFNATTTDLIDVGTSADADHYCNDIDVSSTGEASRTLLNVGAVESSTDPTKVYATFTQTGTAATAGACTIVVEYVFDE